MKINSLRAFYLQHPEQFCAVNRHPQTWSKNQDMANPLSRYREFAGQSDQNRPAWPAVVCIAESEDGQFGIGMSSHAGPVVPLINDYLSQLVCGENLFATERLWNKMVRCCAASFGAAGIASYGISAVDLALWDLKGKVLGKPVYELVGGPARDEIHCYATGMDIDWYLECGFQAIKLCALQGPEGETAALNRNEQSVATIRHKLGDDFDLMIDLWPFHDAKFTVEMASRLSQYDLRWIEDYLHPEDFESYRAVRQRLPQQTLAAGERWYTDRPFSLAAHERWVDILQPDIQWVGGVTGVLKVATIAEAAGLEIALHAGLNDAYGQHLCLALPGNRWGEFYVASAPEQDLLAGYRPTPGMALPKDGKLTPNPAPGFGIEITRAQLELAI
ncbi:MAG: L-rhamnonate dehydratase [Parasphingorhabdus sp.]|jgi:L-rhamnonate dehydratase